MELMYGGLVRFPHENESDAMGVRISIGNRYSARMGRATTPTVADAQRETRLLTILLEGYGQVEDEKRLFKSGTIATGTILVVGTATAGAAVLEQRSWELMLLFPLVQIALLTVTGVLHLWSIMLAAHALNLEKKINHLAGYDLLEWEIRWFTSTEFYKRRETEVEAVRDAAIGDFPMAPTTQGVSTVLLAFAVICMLTEVGIGSQWAFQDFDLGWNYSIRGFEFSIWTVILMSIYALFITMLINKTLNWWYNKYNTWGAIMFNTMIDPSAWEIKPTTSAEAPSQAGHTDLPT